MRALSSSLVLVALCLACGAEAEPSLGQQLAEKPLVDEIAREREQGDLGETLGGDTEDIDALVKKYDAASWKNFISFISDEDDELRYMRHLDATMVITTASNRRDQQDASFVLRPPVCPPGDAAKGCPAQPAGAIACFTLESANYAGYLLSQQANTNKVELRKTTAAQGSLQTVCAFKGLERSSRLSLQFLSANGKFITNRNSLLRLCESASDKTSGCGVTTKSNFAKQATFQKTTGTFVGTCPGPDDLKNCKCVDGWMGRHCNVQCLGQDSPLGICSGHGTCSLDQSGSKPAAKCSCKAGGGWIGVACESQCPMHNNQPCGGPKIGTCLFHPINGPSCKCTDERKGSKCQLQCPGISKGNPCSGHGSCSADAKDSAATCKCDKGFLGAACDKGCPVADGKMCSGYGSCNLDKFGRATCTCETGRHGKACDLKCPRSASGKVCGGAGACVAVNGKATCACEDGHLGDTCEHKCPGLVGGKTCSGHGQCALVPTSKSLNKAECTCSVAYGGKDCLLACKTDANGLSCSGRGKCGAKGKCECNLGFMGETCEHQCPMSKMKVCGGNGKCIASAAGDKATCKCKQGFMGPACDSACPESEGSICAGRGICKYDQLASKSVCGCNEGYMGDSCQFGCPGVHRNGKGCSGHGACGLVPDITNPVGAKCNTCLEGFVGRDCGLRCPGLVNGGKACSGNGKCADVNGKAVCTCRDGFKGPGCDIKCPTNKIGSPCSLQGTCVLSGTKTSCKCKEGFLGAACQHACPTNTIDSKVCSNRGTCTVAIDGKSASCECVPGAIGEACDQGCPMGKNSLPCSGHGACQLKEKNGGCKCQDGWTKADCSHPACTVPSAIFNKVTGQCVCPAGNICCNPKSLAAKRAKEAKIRQLRSKNKELSTMLEEAESRLTH